MDELSQFKRIFAPTILLFMIFLCLFGISSASAPNPGHTWSEVGDVAVTVAQGGTGQSSLTANNVILGNDASAVAFVAPSTTGNVLKSNGTTWVSGTPSGRDIFAGRSVAVVTADTFCHLTGSAICGSTAGTAMALWVPFAGTVKNLRAYMGTAYAATKSLAFTVQSAPGCNDSWSNTALTCTVVGDGATVTCADAVNSVTITAGDCLRMSLDVTGSSVTGSNSWSVEYDY